MPIRENKRRKSTSSCPGNDGHVCGNNISKGILKYANSGACVLWARLQRAPDRQGAGACGGFAEKLGTKLIYFVP